MKKIVAWLVLAGLLIPLIALASISLISPNSASPKPFAQNASLSETRNDSRPNSSTRGLDSSHPSRSIFPTAAAPNPTPLELRYHGTTRVGAVGQEAPRPYSREEVIALIEEHAEAYSVDIDLVLAIARCESGFRWDSRNPSSSASGVFQYLTGTWTNTPAGKQGLSVFDARANVHMAIASIATTGTAPWAASQHCWDT